MITFLMIIMAKDSLLNLVLLVNLHISSLIYFKYCIARYGFVYGERLDASTVASAFQGLPPTDGEIRCSSVADRTAWDVTRAQHESTADSGLHLQ